MAQALIQINGTTGSAFDLSIGTLVTLNNLNNGGETTYLWSIVDQPAGTADTLSSTTVQSPTFTPKKEGTYLIQVIVNGSSATPLINSVVAVIRQVRTRFRIPAAQETTQGDAAEGWHGTPSHPGMEALLQFVDQAIADPGVIVGQVGTTHPARGNVCYVTGEATILSGLPGQALIGVFDTALATTPAQVQTSVFVLEGGVDGSGSPAVGALARFRFLGRFTGVTDPGTLGADMFVSNTGTLSSTPGTTRRKVGQIIATTGSVADVLFDQAVFDESPSGSVFVRRDGSTPMTANWAFGAFALTGMDHISMGAVGSPGAGGIAITGSSGTGGVWIQSPSAGPFFQHIYADAGGDVVIGAPTGAAIDVNIGLLFPIVFTTTYGLFPGEIRLSGSRGIIDDDGTTQTVGAGNTTGSTIINAHGGTATGIIFELGGTIAAGIHLTAATFDSGPVLDLSQNIGGVGIAYNIGNSAKSSNFNVLSQVTEYPCDPSSVANLLATLPALSSVPVGIEFWIWDDVGSSTSSHKITLVPSAADKIRQVNANFTIAQTAFAGARVKATKAGWSVNLVT